MVYGVLQEETWSKEPSIEGNPTEIHSKQHTFMNDESWDEYYNEETAEYN